MDERVRQKLLELGYDPERKEKATSTDVYALFKQYLGGLVLFSGRVVAKSDIIMILEDENMYITTTELEDTCSEKAGKKRSLYISPLEKRIKTEYIRMYNLPSVIMFILIENATTLFV